MSDHYEPTIATTLPAQPVVTETAFIRAVRTVVRPLRGMRWTRVLPLAVIVAAAGALCVCAVLVGATPWSILRDAFVALRRRAGRSACRHPRGQMWNTMSQSNGQVSGC
jgi:hypothetical protein